MRDRRHIFFQGPEGSGKTTLIKRLVESSREALWLVCRVRPSPKPKWDGRWDLTDENNVFDDTGVTEFGVYYEPPEPRDTVDFFWESDFILNYSDAIAYEGSDLRAVAADLYVHVMRPLHEGEGLFSFGETEVDEIDARECLEILGLPLPKDARLLRDEKRREIDDEEDDEAVTEERVEIPDTWAKLILKAVRNEPIRVKKRLWRLHPSHDRIARCGLVVINIHDEFERPAAERTRRMAEELRSRHEVRNDILGLGGERRRITIVVANLFNPRNPELRKALARIKRVLSRGGC
jgi:hypothetical protein